jgi:trans-aconitate methyltransferase
MRTRRVELLAFHKSRYEYLLSKLERLLVGVRQTRPEGQIRILDVGLSMLTQAIVLNWTEAVVDTVGFADARYHSARGNHYQWDLNEAQYRDKWLDIGPYDIIVFAEVLEHLYTAPRLVLSCLAAWLRPGGCLLIQTPNAASLSRRVALLMGRNPYEMIRENPTNPGHFREYTVAELKSIAKAAGLDVAEVAVRNYFSPPGWRDQLYRRACDCLPASFRDGITMAPIKPRS